MFHNLGFNYLSSGLSLVKILGGISKTLGIAKEVIPIYNQFKPIYKFARDKIPNIIDKLSTVNSESIKKTNDIYNNAKDKFKLSSSDNLNNGNAPVFFQ